MTLIISCWYCNPFTSSRHTDSRRTSTSALCRLSYLMQKDHTVPIFLVLQPADVQHTDVPVGVSTRHETCCRIHTHLYNPKTRLCFLEDLRVIYAFSLTEIDYTQNHRFAYRYSKIHISSDEDTRSTAAQFDALMYRQPRKPTKTHKSDFNDRLYPNFAPSDRRLARKARV